MTSLTLDNQDWMSVRECRFVTLTSGSATLFHTQRHATVTVVCRPRNSHWSASRTCKQLSLVRVRDDTQVRHEPVCRPRNSLCFTQHSRCVWRCTQLSLVSVTNLHATLTGQRHEPARNSHWSASRTCTQLSLVSVTNLCVDHATLSVLHTTAVACVALPLPRNSHWCVALPLGTRERGRPRERVCVCIRNALL
jgi:hypothetical protein